MTFLRASVAAAALLIASNAALAADAPAATKPAATATTMAAPTPAIDYAARCTSLAGQWDTALAANAQHAKLGKAKAQAAKGEKLCKSIKTGDAKKGSKAYEGALKQLGVAPT